MVARPGVPLGVIVLLVAGLCACRGGGAEDERTGSAPPGPGDLAPTYQATTLDGERTGLAALEGEVALLNVWATWCAPCRREVPDLEALYEAHADRGLRVVGVSVDSRTVRDQVDRFVADFGVTYDVWLDPDQAALAAFGANGVPLTILIDREGRIVWRRLGPLAREDPELLAAVDSLLRTP
jgi:thiol-disulfide isomerase/thioredoxin